MCENKTGIYKSISRATLSMLYKVSLSNHLVYSSILSTQEEHLATKGTEEDHVWAQWDLVGPEAEHAENLTISTLSMFMCMHLNLAL